MSRTQCRYCLAAWNIPDHECEHGEREFGVARQIAEQIHGGPPTDEQVGWFMDDAEVICGTVTDPTPVVRWMPKTFRLYAGDAAFRVHQEDGSLVFVSRKSVRPTKGTTDDPR